MQELLSEMSHPNWDRLSFDARYEMFDKLLDLEKEQICNAYVEGLEGLWISAEEYYNREFNQNK